MIVYKDTIYFFKTKECWNFNVFALKLLKWNANIILRKIRRKRALFKIKKKRKFKHNSIAN
jgi:hypothetical protein